MRNIVKNLNKRSLADATEVSYSRLRKFASGDVEELREDEIKAIYDYLLELTQVLENILYNLEK